MNMNYLAAYWIEGLASQEEYGSAIKERCERGCVATCKAFLGGVGMI